MGLLDDNLIERVDEDIYNDYIKRYIFLRRGKISNFLPYTALCKNIIHDYDIHNCEPNELYLYVLNYLYDYSSYSSYSSYTYDILITKNYKQHVIDKNCKPLYTINWGRLTMSDILWACS